MNYDVIGDIHGHAGKLSALLRKLGYRERAGSWVPPEGAMAIFVGDLIDRGPDQLATLDIVRGMVDGGHARCVMGNHEFNAIAYATRRQGTDDFLRPHSDKNNRQHDAFLRAVEGDSRKYRELIDWFRTLPVALDLGGIRAVHAWWNLDFVRRVDEARGGKPLDDAFMHQACTKGTELYAAMDGLTKGCEVELPGGHDFVDHDGTTRHEVRVRWWMAEPTSYRDYAAMDSKQQAALPDLPVEAQHRLAAIDGAPVFVGHYWFDGPQRLDSTRLACVDYSAAKEGQPLVAYRWQGEPELTDKHFVSAGA
ncbi:metallophosphoesterase [Ramlibacter solisilvae]|uniref:Calcineurin-like phosphoesterase domain-containing protein n=1 Tax=Ramlibacter tataouinensis TaxID=94132 RepID=A0A127JTF7_9BURK|nr:metallophosphoesterase [Ramlibacter tataouinensis]AMO23247.1 hypothetical protein UC35_10520 [Ramlibacter tataouinensis]